MKKSFAFLVFALTMLAFFSQPLHAQTPDLTGAWTGTVDAVSAKGGFFEMVPVSMEIVEQRMLGSGLFFRGFINISPPYGSGNSIPITGNLEMGGGVDCGMDGGMSGGMSVHLALRFSPG